jgi:glutathione S-transferase
VVQLPDAQGRPVPHALVTAEDRSAALQLEAQREELLAELQGTLEATADGIMDAAVSMAYEKRIRPEEFQYEPWLEAQWAKVSRALDALDSRWMAHLHGPLDMGQIAVGCALGYLDLRHDARNWRSGRDALAAWEARFAERDSMRATVPQA